jgi:hypothetical protein
MSDETLRAGDSIAESRKDGEAIDKAGESNTEKREAPPAPVAVPVTDVVIDTSVSPRFDGIRCATCREVKKDEQLMKQPIEYKHNQDGSVSFTGARFSIFCGTCQKFLGIYDPVAQHELSEMLRKRNASQ